VTVNLVSLPEIQATVPQQKQQARRPVEKPPEVKKIEPVKAEVQVPRELEPPPEKVQPVRPVSLKPVKRKVRKTDPKKLAREKERKRALARVKREEKQARRAAEEARAALAEMIRQKGTRSAASTTPRRSTGGRQVQSIVLQNYYSALYDQIQRYWVLPDMRKWDARLETVVVLTIRRDGTVARKVVEKKSKDPFFDQFVMKTLESALPLPRFPKLMTQASIEVGLRFKPGELIM
jgi:colicin import membrane protein